jgi:hypothetical protein
MTAIANAARVLAIAIAVLGFVDPAITSLRSTRADIAIIAMERSDSALAAQLGRRLDDDYNVIRGPFVNAAATIVVGSALPERIPSGAIYAVRDTSAITRFDVPAEIQANAKIAIPVSRPVELAMNGVVVDTGSTPTLTPTATGPTVIQARAGEMSADALTNVVDRQHAVLFFDRRPSWMSTFVRRSLEQDRRFAVASRVITSRGVSTDAGQPPSTLSDPALLELYDVIVIGAPTSLTAADVSGLETFLRRRGGSVVLLYDEVPTAGAHDRLTGVSRWTPASLRAATRVRADGDTAALMINEAAWPTSLPVAADVRATLCHPDRNNVVPSRARDPHVQVPRCARDDKPVVWATGAGAGQVIVSGALDSWKFRDPATSGFDEFWRATISRAAREASEAVTVTVTPNIAEPGEPITVRISTSCRPKRSEGPDLPEKQVLRCAQDDMNVSLDSARLDAWPTDRPGEFSARLRAPAVGDHWIRASANEAKAEAPLAVRPTVTRIGRSEWPTVQMIARASGGVAGSIDDVERAVRERVVPERRMERWWPMRSGWWILPFVGLLGLEWLVRRRRGLA